MEDLPLGRIAALVPEFAVKDLPLGRTLMMTTSQNIRHFLNTLYINLFYLFILGGPGGSSGKALSCGLDGPGSLPGVGGLEIFLHSFVSRLALGSTQPPIK